MFTSTALDLSISEFETHTLDVVLLVFSWFFPVFPLKNQKIRQKIHFPAAPLRAEKCDLLQRPGLPAASHLPSDLQRKDLRGDQWNDEPRRGASEHGIA